MRNAKYVAPAIVLLCCAVSAGAQLNSDTVPTGRTVPLREGVEAQLAESRWHIGPFRVDPELTLGDIGYNDNVLGASEGEEKVGDYTASVGLGLRSIAPFGDNVFLRVNALPTYTWYKDLEERRQFGYDVDGALLLLFNRMSIEAGTHLDSSVTQVSSEDATPVPQTTENAIVKFEFELLPRLDLFAAYEAENNGFEPQPGDVNYTLLNREETAQRVGLRYELRPRFHLYAMYEMTDSLFPDDDTYSENEGEAILGGFTYDRDQLFVNAVGGNRTIDYPGSGAPGFDEFTGSLFASWRFARRTTLGVRVSQRPQYSTFVDNPYFLESRQGASLDVPMGQRFIVFGSMESGKNEYQSPVVAGDALIERVDDVSNWEAGIGIRVSRTAILTFSMREEKYESNVVGFDRDVVTTGINLNLGTTLY